MTRWCRFRTADGAVEQAKRSDRLQGQTCGCLFDETICQKVRGWRKNIIRFICQIVVIF